MAKKHFATTFGLLFALSIAVVAAVYVIDTDGGYNIYEEGTCTIYDGGNQTNFTDYCINGDDLREYYPNASNTTCYWSNVDCTVYGFSWGCKDNICRHYAMDTDGGNEPLVQGTCTYHLYINETHQYNKSLTDWCLGNGNLNYPRLKPQGSS